MPSQSTHLSLQTALDVAGLKASETDLGLPLSEPGSPRRPRSDILLVDRNNSFGTWTVPSLTSLFRGARVAPDLQQYPPDYVPVFAFIEQRVVSWAQATRTPTDSEMEEVYSNLRRRPDGRSLNATHDAVWQIAAFTLGEFELSAAEFDASFGQLAKSARRWKLGSTSREYLPALAKMFKPPAR
jgi:hypothetical protein